MGTRLGRLSVLGVYSPGGSGPSDFGGRRIGEPSLPARRLVWPCRPTLPSACRTIRTEHETCPRTNDRFLGQRLIRKPSCLAREGRDASSFALARHPASVIGSGELTPDDDKSWRVPGGRAGSSPLSAWPSQLWRCLSRRRVQRTDLIDGQACGVVPVPLEEDGLIGPPRDHFLHRGAGLDDVVRFAVDL